MLPWQLLELACSGSALVSQKKKKGQKRGREEKREPDFVAIQGFVKLNSKLCFPVNTAVKLKFTGSGEALN